MMTLDILRAIIVVIYITTPFVSSESHYRPDQSDTFKTEGPPNDGKWTEPMYCPKDEFAIGFELQWEKYRGSHASWCAQKNSDGSCRSNPSTVPTRDDNGVTGMTLRCGSFNYSQLIFSGSTVGRFPSQSEVDYALLTGIESRITTCKSSLVVGLVVRMQKRQGTGDDAGITNVKLQCEDGEMIGGSVDYDERLPEVDRAQYSCKKGQAVCGLKLKTEYDHHDDNEGLNDILMYCCKVPKILNTPPSCEPEIKWVKVNEVRNTGTTWVTSKLTTTVGLTKQSGSKNVDKESETNGKETGYGIEFQAGPEYARIKASFEQKFSQSSTKETERETESVQIFQNERSHEQEIRVPPKHIHRVSQQIGVCGGVEVRTGNFKTEDECIPGFEEICQQFMGKGKEEVDGNVAATLEKKVYPELTSGGGSNYYNFPSGYYNLITLFALLFHQLLF